MEGFYPDSVSKIGLTVAVGQSAKATLVKDEGIGEELAMNILGWRDDELVCVAQMDVTWDSDEEERIKRTGDAYIIMRRGWACDSFTIMAEGYLSRKPDETRDAPLVDSFLDPEKGVSECLTITYVDEIDTELCAVPFRVGVGRKLHWGPMIHTTDIDILRNSAYVTAAQMVLAQECQDLPEDIDTLQLALAIGLHDTAGYFIQYDL